MVELAGAWHESGRVAGASGCRRAAGGSGLVTSMDARGRQGQARAAGSRHVRRGPPHEAAPQARGSSLSSPFRTIKHEKILRWEQIH